MAIPVTPDEAQAQYKKNELTSIPDFVINTINELLIARVSNSYSGCTITQEEITTEVQKAYPSQSVTPAWWNFPVLYEKHGWTVSYPKSGPRVYTFKKYAQPSGSYRD